MHHRHRANNIVSSVVFTSCSNHCRSAPRHVGLTCVLLCLLACLFACLIVACLLVCLLACSLACSGLVLACRQRCRIITNPIIAVTIILLVVHFTRKLLFVCQKLFFVDHTSASTRRVLASKGLSCKISFLLKRLCRASILPFHGTPLSEYAASTRE
jgi:hypothetical protein